MLVLHIDGWLADLGFRCVAVTCVLIAQVHSQPRESHRGVLLHEPLWSLRAAASEHELKH